MDKNWEKLWVWKIQGLLSVVSPLIQANPFFLPR